VYYLLRRFFALPAQAIRCELAFLAPTGETWSPEAGEILSRACGSAVLNGEIYKVEDESLQIFLTKKGGDGEEIYLNDVLLEANLAIFSVAT